MAINFVISSCLHDTNRWNFCKNWDGSSNMEIKCPKNIIKPASSAQEKPIVDFIECPFHVIGNTNIGDPTWGIDENTFANVETEPVTRPQEEKVLPKPKPKQKKKAKDTNSEPAQINML